MQKKLGFVLAVLIATIVMVMGGCEGNSGNGGGMVNYSMSGTITNGGSVLAGVTVTLSGSGSTKTTTDSSGNYSFSSAKTGSYTLTPNMNGYTFIPASQSITVNGANITGQNFTAIATTANTYSISGTIITGGNALAGVTVSTAEGSATNDTSGNYIISGLANGSYTLTPSKIGYTFTPVNIFTTVNGANIPGINFTATSTITNGTTTGTVQLPKTGQTVSSAAGDDGSVRKGIAWPNPRFTDNGNGTVTDNLTGLIWLKNASCFNMQMWTTALASANTLASGACGLNDGTSAGQWRLPNINELESLVDISQSPALPTGHPFLSVQSGYWSASSYPNDTSYAWYIYMNSGNVFSNEKRYGSLYVWPVREGAVNL